MLSSQLSTPRVQGQASRREGGSRSRNNGGCNLRSTARSTASSSVVVASSSTSGASRGHFCADPLTAGDISDTASYLSSVALSQPPARLQALCAALSACGASALAPGDRRGLHPLVVPLGCVSRMEGGNGGEDQRRRRLLASLMPLPSTSAAFAPSNSSNSKTQEVVIGLLRVPSEQRGLQVVSCTRGAPAMELLARSADELLIRLLAEEEAFASALSGGGGGERNRPLAAAAGPSADGLLSASLLAAAAKAAATDGESSSSDGEGGETGKVSTSSLDRALVAAGALSPALCERLLASHLRKSDEMSALITGEWYMRRNHFPGWARPYEHVSKIYASLNRKEEARDCSRVALSLPWWTLGSGFREAAKLAGLPEDGKGARAALEAAERGAGGLPPVTNRDERQRVLDAFAAVLDDGACSSSSSSGSEVVDWPSFAERGAGVLEEGGEGLRGLAAFVRGAV